MNRSALVLHPLQGPACTHHRFSLRSRSGNLNRGVRPRRNSRSIQWIRTALAVALASRRGHSNPRRHHHFTRTV